MADLQTLWTAHFGATLPIGHRLRLAYPERWVRFHALVDATRYASSAAERTEILSRANQIAAVCFEGAPSVWLMSSVFGDPAANPLLHLYNLNKAFSWQDQEDPEHFGDCYAQEVRWENGKFDPMFEAIAADHARALIFAPTTGTVLAPYDGGFDVISSRSDTVTAMFSGWLSPRTDGL